MPPNPCTKSHTHLISHSAECKQKYLIISLGAVNGYFYNYCILLGDVYMDTHVHGYIKHSYLECCWFQMPFSCRPSTSMLPCTKHVIWMCRDQRKKQRGSRDRNLESHLNGVFLVVNRNMFFSLLNSLALREREI